jgi:hypothetical protein
VAQLFVDPAVDLPERGGGGVRVRIDHVVLGEGKAN